MLLQLLLHAIIRDMKRYLPAVYEHRRPGQINSRMQRDTDMGEILLVSPSVERLVTLKLIKHAGVVVPAEDVSPTAGTRIR